MPGVDLTRYISFAALAVSLGSASVSLLSYRRSGHRTQAHLGTSVSSFGDTAPNVIFGTFTVVNAGQGSVQVVDFGLLFDDSPVLYSLEAHSYTGPELPTRLEGLQTMTWTCSHADLVWLVDQIDPRPVKVRGIVILGSGKSVRTARKAVPEWLSVTANPTPSRRRGQGYTKSTHSPHDPVDQSGSS
jgi:hypothetical protein